VKQKLLIVFSSSGANSQSPLGITTV
jgi:hypothetical protein